MRNLLIYLQMGCSAMKCSASHQTCTFLCDPWLMLSNMLETKKGKYMKCMNIVINKINRILILM